MESNQITIKFSNVILHESNLPDMNRRLISRNLNQVLESIKNEIIACEGTVEVIESKKGNFSFLSACGNTELKDKMNDLISHSMSKLRKDQQASGN